MPEAFWLRPVMAVTAGVQPESYMPDPTSRIRFGSVLPKKAWVILCKTVPVLICKTWSGLGRMHFGQYELCVLRLPVLLCAGFCRAENNVLTALQARLQRYRTLPSSRASCSRLGTKTLPEGTKPRTSHHRWPGGDRRGKRKR